LLAATTHCSPTTSIAKLHRIANGLPCTLNNAAAAALIAAAVSKDLDYLAADGAGVRCRHVCLSFCERTDVTVREQTSLC
jgi:hypothetical protein